ncbi:MAG: hypothetical protein ACR2MG_14785 [Pyrinomonadaceae bacterium]
MSVLPGAQASLSAISAEREKIADIKVALGVAVLRRRRDVAGRMPALPAKK